MTEQVIHGRQVEVHLPGILWFEGSSFEFQHDITAKFDVIEEQVDEKLFAAHFQLELLAEKRETRPKLEQKLPDMGDQTLLNLSLLGLPCRGEELEVVGVFQQLPREVGLALGIDCSKLVLALPCRS